MDEMFEARSRLRLRPRGTGIALVASGFLLVATAGSWLLSRRREGALDKRTRARLSPASASSAAAAPSAVDIHIGE